jgi:hypothetical protein
VGFEKEPNTMMLNIDTRLLDVIPHIGTDGFTLLLLIAKRLSKKGEAFPSQDLLMKESGMGIDRLKNALKRLKDHGLLSYRQARKKGGKMGSNVYKLNTPYLSIFVPAKDLEGRMNANSYTGEPHTVEPPPKYYPTQSIHTPLPPKGGVGDVSDLGTVQEKQTAPYSQEATQLMEEARRIAYEADPITSMNTSWVAGWWDRLKLPANTPDALKDDLPQLFINAVVAAVNAKAHTPGYVQKAFKSSITNWKADGVKALGGAPAVGKTVGQKLMHHPYLRHKARPGVLLKTDEIQLLKRNGVEVFQLVNGDTYEVGHFQKAVPTSDELEVLNR